MSVVYIKTNNLDITHEDQEQHGLKFAVQVEKDDVYYIKVIGEDAEIDTWKARVNGEDSSLDEINTIKESLPNPNSQNKELAQAIADLILQNADLKNQVQTLSQTVAQMQLG